MQHTRFDLVWIVYQKVAPWSNIYIPTVHMLQFQNNRIAQPYNTYHVYFI